VTPQDRGTFLLDYIDLLLGGAPVSTPPASHDRWVVNKLRALCGYYTRGFDGGSHLRVAVNHAPSVSSLRDLVGRFFESAT
jgi:hypothetical protein